MLTKYLLIFVMVLHTLFLHSEEYSLKIKILNQPSNTIYFGLLKGDDIEILDSTFAVQEDIRFSIPVDAVAGVYRLILGQNTYAKIMNLPPQKFDFIFNHENLEFETNFRFPTDSLKVIQSVENKIWYDYKKAFNPIQEKLKSIEAEIDYCNAENRKSAMTADKLLLQSTNCSRYKLEFNLLQSQRDSLIYQTINKSKFLFVSKVIKFDQEPMRDGYLSKEERDQIFRTQFLKKLEFNDAALINTPVYTETAFKYLFSFARHGLSPELQEKEFIKAVDEILLKSKKNDEAYNLILDYLIDGFEKLELDNIIQYIADNYSVTSCENNDKTTLERKLLYRKMKKGMAMPEVSFTDSEGKSISLISKPKSGFLLIFWSSACPHCHETIPQIKKLAEKYVDTEFVFVSLDTNRSVWENTVNKLNISDFKNYCDYKSWYGELATKLNIYATPTMLLFDNQLKLISKPISISGLQNSLSEKQLVY